MKKKLLLALVFISFLNALACLNGDSKELKNGTPLYWSRESKVPHGNEYLGDEELGIQVKVLDSLYRSTKDLDYLSDKGLVLIFLKQYDKAIQLYLEIEKKEPGRYSTASNMGTAYELIGENNEAYKWIKKSVEIDSNSHYRSEWIHVKILEAKIKGDDFITSQFLLNVNFGDGRIPESSMTNKELEELSSALYFQLNERITFIQQKDKIVAHLMFDLGNTEFLLGNYNDALDDYQIAKAYGFDEDIIKKRMFILDLIRSKWLIYTGLGGLLFVTIFFIYRNKRKKIEVNSR